MSDLLYDTVSIQYGKNEERTLTVRGLCTSDLSVLIRKHKEQLTQIYEFVEQGWQQEDVGSQAFGWELLEQFPGLAAHLIALAADKSNQVDGVSKLPIPVQLKALSSIYDLTITDTGGLNDFLELATNMFTQVRTGMQSLK